VQTDYVQRFLFENLDVRGRLVCLTGAWRRMTEGRAYPPRIAELLGQSTAIAHMLGANQKDIGRITLQVQGSGPVKLLVADCTPDLKIRGMAHHEGDALMANPALGEGRIDPPFEHTSHGQIYQSLVPLEGDSMAEIFQNYLQRSEQRVSFLRLLADRAAISR